MAKVASIYPHFCLRPGTEVIWQSQDGTEYFCECEIPTPHLERIINYLTGKTSYDGVGSKSTYYYAETDEETLSEMEEALVRREKFFEKSHVEGESFSWDERISG